MVLIGSKFVLRVTAGEEREYGHFFGGPTIHESARFAGAKQALHLLYCFNLSDPLLSDVKRVEGVQWLPLYYGFQFDECEFGYLVEAGDRMRVFSRKQTFVPDFPYKGYPERFPRTAVRVEPIEYEARKSLLLAHLLMEQEDDWDLQGLSSPDRQMLKTWHYPFTQFGGCQRLMQDEPLSPCPNPRCERYGQKGGMAVLATVWNQPIPGLKVWGDHGDFVQLVYEQCQSCSAIHVCNQCD